MGFVDDDEIPRLLPHPLANIVLFAVVDGCDYLPLPLPEVQKLLLVVRGVNDLERFVEEAQQFVLPLDGQGRGNEDEASIDRIAQLQFLNQQARHDRLAGAGIIGEQKPQARLGEHLQVDRLDLVRQGADARQAHRELAVIGVRKADSDRLDQ